MSEITLVPKTTKRNAIIGLIIAAAVIIILGMVIAAKSSELKKTQAELESTKTELAAANKVISDAEEAAKDKTFDYLAIGNSITQLPIMSDQWWGQWGMAASTEENDYYHQVVAGLQELYPDATINAEAANFAFWEFAFYGIDARDYYLPYLDAYLNEDLDFITIELGENFSTEVAGMDLEDYQVLTIENFEHLVEYIKERCPKAKIAVMQTYWNRPVVEVAKQTICEEYDLEYIDLTEILDESTRIGYDGVVYGEDGEEHEVGESIAAGGLSQHPADEAMAYMAQQVLMAAPEDWKPEK